MVTDKELLELCAHEDKRYLVAVETVHPLEDIVKITYKKRTPKLLTFVYTADHDGPHYDSSSRVPGPTGEGEGGAKDGFVARRFVVERPTECIRVVTKAVDHLVRSKKL